MKSEIEKMDEEEDKFSFDNMCLLMEPLREGLYVYFHQFIEIFKNTNFYFKKKISVLCYGKSSIQSSFIMKNMFDLNKENINLFESKFISGISLLKYKMFDFIICDDKMNSKKNNNIYINELLNTLYLSIKHLNDNGNMIIKIDELYYKPILDIFYLFLSLFDKCEVMKTYSSNSLSYEKYILCKMKIKNKKENDILLFIDEFKKRFKYIVSFQIKNIFITSILNFELPGMFLNKVNELNSVIGQSQIESLKIILNILNHINKEDKLKQLIQYNLEKTNALNVKYFPLSFNKNFDTNIFLHLYEF
jgi:hypothetical protein